ncbi:HET-domain-containing protein, partial [Cadophora sp. DSE1049]
STSSRSVIQQAARWLDQCVNNHATCRHATTLTIPKRLLYLETVDKRIQVKLVELDENFSDLKYATLSYCWGKGSACKLTRASLETMRSGILLSDLPKTVQDALHVTQQLGLHWLWVDSLCIIQDSVDDWSSEAASMVDVYRNCLICIAATGAYCSDEGLFAQRDPYIYQPCPISNSSDATTLFAYPHRGLGNQGDFSLCFFESPLHKRGWVMQERLLPPRTLSFGSIVVWECCEHYRDEFCLSRGIEGGTLKGGFSSLVLQQVGPRQITPEEEAKILSLWQTIMQAYTQANLTVKTDKLVALSGVIRAIERSTGWRNIYGVWEPFLVYELLWRKQVSDSLGTTALPGASWSWVSWNGEI